MDFKTFAKAVNLQFDTMTTGKLFITDLGKDTIWDIYQASFPEGTNPIFRERPDHDCQCCKSFIRRLGNVVGIEDGKITTIWDITVGGTYQVVADALAKAVRESNIRTIYLSSEKQAGVAQTKTLLEDGTIEKWNHFHCDIPTAFVDTDMVSKLGKSTQDKLLIERGLTTITPESVAIVLDLIAQDSIYRGAEHQSVVSAFKVLQKNYSKAENKELFVWNNLTNGAGFIRNSVIGTLLTDLSDGIELTAAVKSFESKVAPENYKRTTALVTKGMIKTAMKTITELGIEDSLQRRHATSEDISVNNVLFSDKSTSMKDKMSVEALLMGTVKESAKSFDKVEEIGIEDFITNVVPTADTIELMLANKHEANLVSLVAPTEATAPGILAWDNNFSWSYAGNVTDSLKAKVKSAGGNVTGEVRVSLGWYNADDLDISVIEPGGHTVYYGTKNGKTGCRLDVDMNAGGRNNSTDPVENITWERKATMVNGNYKVVVHNFTKRSSSNPGFTVEVEMDGVLKQFHYKNAVKDGERITTFYLVYKDGKLSIKDVNPKLNNEDIAKQLWNKTSLQFQKVSLMMLSPNYWDGQSKGNKHYFFAIEGLLNPESTRGLYSEFLDKELTPHRKVFELLGDKLKCEYSDEQLACVGFSSTTRNEVVCRVTGTFNRTLKIKF